ncbi:BRO-N domain-containing protein [Rhodopirellula europaea]|uniref:BRO-N domain-containing protein n=1 Tax=Rhodopirellula europaea TaxID=1263866 RepID=UPI003D26C0D3
MTGASEAWFSANEVCGVLGYSAPRNAVARHCEADDALKRCTIDSIGREQQSIFVNEAGIYALIFGSKLPAAKRLKHWVFNDVLPSIRKTGSYGQQKIDLDDTSCSFARCRHSWGIQDRNRPARINFASSSQALARPSPEFNSLGWAISFFEQGVSCV